MPTIIYYHNSATIVVILLKSYGTCACEKRRHFVREGLVLDPIEGPAYFSCLSTTTLDLFEYI